jgi:hypothetical protein
VLPTPVVNKTVETLLNIVQKGIPIDPQMATAAQVIEPRIPTREALKS